MTPIQIQTSITLSIILAMADPPTANKPKLPKNTMACIIISRVIWIASEDSPFRRDPELFHPAVWCLFSLYEVVP